MAAEKHRVRSATSLAVLALLSSFAPAQCPPTEAQIEGPYWIAGSPETNDLVVPGDGPLLSLSGQVLDTDCQPIPFAWLDLWHADPNGDYDNTGPTYTYRGHTFTDEFGNYAFETILPGLYPGRTRHLHFKVEGDNTPLLTTQLYFPGEPANATDLIYDPDLEVVVVSLEPNGDRVATFDFALPSTCTAPTIAQEPAPVAVLAGDGAIFVVGATGTAAFAYQWRKDGVDIGDGGGTSGSATDTLLLASVTSSDAGSYDCVVANACGSAMSAAATLVITGAGTDTLVRSDCNADGSTDVADPVMSLAYLFSAGATPLCLDACDANDDGAVNVADAVFTLSYLFQGLATPAPPFPGCGEDTTADALSCDVFPPCP